MPACIVGKQFQFYTLTRNVLLSAIKYDVGNFGANNL